ncbi:hypothetical protein L209DRAFT_588422 [Thermothelomyces heterothallicus CBS 203.75]
MSAQESLFGPIRAPNSTRHTASLLGQFSPSTNPRSWLISDRLAWGARQGHRAQLCEAGTRLLTVCILPSSTRQEESHPVRFFFHDPSRLARSHNSGRTRHTVTIIGRGSRRRIESVPSVSFAAVAPSPRNLLLILRHGGSSGCHTSFPRR